MVSDSKLIGTKRRVGQIAVLDEIGDRVAMPSWVYRNFVVIEHAGKAIVRICEIRGASRCGRKAEKWRPDTAQLLSYEGVGFGNRLMRLVKDNGRGTVCKMCKKSVVLRRNGAQLGKACLPRIQTGDAAG